MAFVEALGSSLFSVQWQMERAALAGIFPIAKRLNHSAQGCQEPSYPGENQQPCANLKGLNQFHNIWYSTLSGLDKTIATTQGRPSRNRANPGLNDPIPLELKTRFASIDKDAIFYFTENSGEPVSLAV